MRLIRVYLPQQLTIGQQITLEHQLAHRLLQVLRLSVGDQLQLFDGRGHEYFARINQIRKKIVTLVVEQELACNNESPLRIHLGQALLRSQKMDLVLQKAVEVGVTEVTPILSDYVNAGLDHAKITSRMQHWQQVMIAACEQSQRNVLPILHKPAPYMDWVQSIEVEQKIMWLPQAQQHLTDLAAQANSVAVLIGPEGGFSAPEIQWARQQHFHCCRLGPRILRTETMSIAALAVLQYRWGDY